MLKGVVTNMHCLAKFFRESGLTPCMGHAYYIDACYLKSQISSSNPPSEGKLLAGSSRVVFFPTTCKSQTHSHSRPAQEFSIRSRGYLKERLAASWLDFTFGKMQKKLHINQNILIAYQSSQTFRDVSPCNATLFVRAPGLWPGARPNDASIVSMLPSVRNTHQPTRGWIAG